MIHDHTVSKALFVIEESLLGDLRSQWAICGMNLVAAPSLSCEEPECVLASNENLFFSGWRTVCAFALRCCCSSIPICGPSWRGTFPIAWAWCRITCWGLSVILLVLPYSPGGHELLLYACVS